MLGINRHGDESVIDPVFDRIKIIVKRKRYNESDALILGLELLNKFKDRNQEILKIFEWLKTNKWDFLFEMEKYYIRLVKKQP
ncbi:hypothetical protein V1498_21660 [Peribacillus sp. SCS-26]|uniref:hypothetical protein n=1 Tax=Paraperibacillus marinus TaxID=3115295 RepID=UPI0039062F5D